MGMLYFNGDLFGGNDSAYCGVGELGWDVYACGSCASLVLSPMNRPLRTAHPVGEGAPFAKLCVQF